jgi:hypothetical protein
MKPARAALLFLAGTAIFAAAYCQAPLFYSNQNQYFLHGLAAAGYGRLNEDWLANTADPTPAFSALVAVTARHLPLWTFYVEHALLLGAYAAAMLGLFVRLAGPETARRRWPLFAALLVIAHAGAVRWLSYRLLGWDWPWFLQSGVAGQYLLGSMLQPSSFGVLLAVALCLFAHGRPLLAAVFVGLAADMHATYLLPGAMLTLGFITSLAQERRWREALGTGAIALALVLPVVAYALLTFRPTSPETFAEGQRILVHVRIPHHSRPDLWIDPVSAFQIGWIVLGVALTRGTPLFPVLGVPLVLSAVLTLVQVWTHSDSLALLFPWRVSALLVPVATAVILSRLVAALPSWAEGRAARAISFLAIALLAAAGAWISLGRHGFRVDESEQPLLAYVRDHSSHGDVYLLPVELPNLVASTRGSLSSDFKPLEEKKRDARVIPVGLQRFRLHARAPIFVDFKSIPYKDVDVVEWHRRMLLAQSLQGKLGSAEGLEEARALGVTHVVRHAASPPLEAELVHEDGAYRVYRIVPAERR